MLAAGFYWWLARIRELLPPSWKNLLTGPSHAIVTEADPAHTISLTLHRQSRCRTLTASAASRLRARTPVLLRVPPDAALRTKHIMPAAPRKAIDQALRYELERITPFQANELFWTWDSRPDPADNRRVIVSLILVPRNAIASMLEALKRADLQPDFLEVSSGEQRCLLATGAGTAYAKRLRSTRALSWACAAVVAIGLIMPILLQEYALRATDTAIAQLQPTIRQIETLRQSLATATSEREILAAEAARRGGLIQLLAKLTRLLPDDTYLTELSLRDRQLLLSGRSASAASLIPTFSAQTTFRDAAFAAPVTHAEGASGDLFSIRATIAP